MTLTKKLLIALPLSIVITFALSIAYAFYPLVTTLLRTISAGPETSGVAAVAGGVSTKGLLIVEPIVFVMVFLLLSRKRTT